MKVLINERLSEHKYKTPEGYLICTDAILARTGKQEYRRAEVFGDSCEDSDGVIEIDRREDEVFSPQTLASFENKPITVEHPDVDVNSDNYKDYAVGFVRDVKRGVADGQDVILGTLVITDRQTIEEIENGEHTDLSCGYDCDIVDEDNPQQRNIRGNHVALCAQGRAGIARIVDSKVSDKKFVVYNDDDESFGKFNTREEAKKQIKELRRFDKEQGNPFEEIYRIEVEDSIKDETWTAEKMIKEIDRLPVQARGWRWHEFFRMYHDYHQISKEEFNKFEELWAEKYNGYGMELKKLGYKKDSVNDDYFYSELLREIKKLNTSSYSDKEIYDAVIKLHKQKPFKEIYDCMLEVFKNIDNGNYLLDSVNDSEAVKAELDSTKFLKYVASHFNYSYEKLKSQFYLLQLRNGNKEVPISIPTDLASKGIGLKSDEDMLNWLSDKGIDINRKTLFNLGIYKTKKVKDSKTKDSKKQKIGRIINMLQGNSCKDDKEPRAVREAIDILEGKIAKSEGYILEKNLIKLGRTGTHFPITTNVYNRLVELGYKSTKDACKDSPRQNSKVGDSRKLILTNGKYCIIYDSYEKAYLIFEIDFSGWKIFREGYKNLSEAKLAMDRLSNSTKDSIKDYTTLGSCHHKYAIVRKVNYSKGKNAKVEDYSDDLKEAKIICDSYQRTYGDTHYVVEVATGKAIY